MSVVASPAMSAARENAILVERSPSLAEYRRLREAAGWNALDDAGASEGLAHALYSVCLESDGEVVGCGRVVGDGGIYFYLQDIIVLPAFQGRGLGAMIMDAVMGYLDRAARPGAFVGLMAAEGAADFYLRYGFAPRGPGRPGMFRVWS